MKRMERDPIRFAALEHYTAIARKKGLRLNDTKDVETFGAMMIESLKGAQSKATMLHGKRTEALFAHVAGALGECEMIKVEDAGEVFSAGDEVQAPDYRLILKNGNRMLVEVKNWAAGMARAYTLRRKDFEKLDRYARLDGTPLKIAIYFTRISRWTLLSPESFDHTDNGMTISMASAIAKSEMAMLGDATMATLPELRLELMGNPEEANSLEEGKATITFRTAKIYGGGIELSDQTSQQIAFYFMRFGRWGMTSRAIIQNGKLQGVVFTSSTEDQHDGQPFAFIGELSSMVSAAFAEHTVEDGQVLALDTALDPEAFAPGIPKNFDGLSLSMWGFIMQANHNFQDNVTKQLRLKK